MTFKPSLCIKPNIEEHKNELSRLERRLRSCVVLNATGSSPAQTISFLSAHFTSYGISSPR